MILAEVASELYPIRFKLMSGESLLPKFDKSDRSGDPDDPDVGFDKSKFEISVPEGNPIALLAIALTLASRLPELAHE
jgi:hypothetical protein